MIKRLSWLEKTQDNFVFLDTEGQGVLREIAIIDHQGKLLYEAFVKDHYNNENIRVKLKSLKVITEEIDHLFKNDIKNKIIVCHNAEHDGKILVSSFWKQGVFFPKLSFICTVKLAQKCYPESLSYTLGYLAKQLRLKFNDQFFQENKAHTAYYDAQFTRQLFLNLTNTMSAEFNINSELKNYTNPFNSSRVDDPFQNHPDYQIVYQAEFERLKSILAEIKSDKNHQSKGVVIIGEPGTGKTHLIMRIAQQLLQRNRLLFIRQPNNADTILSHTYARILESFFQPVPNSDRNQIELLIAHSFTEILSSIEQVSSTQQGKKIIEDLQNDSLSLFNRLGAEDTIRHNKNWDIIEKNILDWWSIKYSVTGYSPIILQGLIKFCRYSRADYKAIIRRWLAGNELDDEELNKIGLKNWNDNLSREEFALEAIKVFANLSTLDEPLIIVFDQLEGLGLSQNKDILSSFGSGIKEIITHIPNSLIILNLFPNRWQQFQQYFDEAVTDRLKQNIVTLPKPEPEKLKEILALKAKLVELNLEQIFTTQELTNILSQSSIRKVVNRASDYFNYKAHNIPLPEDNLRPKSPINLEERVILLENTLREIAQLITPFISINNQTNNQEINLIDFFPSVDIDNDKNNDIHQDKIDKNFDELSNPVNNKKVNNIPNSLKQKLFNYLDDKQKILTQEYQKPQIIMDADDIGKLTTILETFKICQTEIDINQLRLARRKIPEHLRVTKGKINLVIAFLNLGGSTFTNRIKNFNELVISYPKFKFTLFRDSREPSIAGKVGKLEIDKLNNTKNGKFVIFDQENRINFELIYGLIIDIQEQNLDLNLENIIKFLPDYFANYWLTSLLKN